MNIAILILVIINILLTIKYHKKTIMKDQEILDKLTEVESVVKLHKEQDANVVATLQKTIDDLLAGDDPENQEIADRLDALKLAIETPFPTMPPDPNA